MAESRIVDACAWSVVASARSSWTFVRLGDDAGRYGFGETAGLDSAGLERALHEAGRAAMGRHATELAQGAAGRSSAARLGIRVDSAIAQAACDLAAQAVERPLASWYVDRPSPAVPLYANLNRGLVTRTAANFARRASEAAEAGFGAVKIAPFDDLVPGGASSWCAEALAAGLGRVSAVRDALPADRRVMVDCHWRFDARGAVTAIEELARRGVDWIECPIAESFDALDDLARLRERARAAGARLAGADEIDDPALFRAIVQAGAYDIVMPDVKHLGGPHVTLALARCARDAGLDVSLHNPTGPVAHAHSVHLTAAIDGALPLETQFAETPLFVSMLDASAARPAEGCARVGSLPGLGLPVVFGRTGTLDAAFQGLGAGPIDRPHAPMSGRRPA